MTPGAGRYAPTPSGDLHVGNLRTALLAWLFARSSGRSFVIRVDDLDPDRARSPENQLADLAALGLRHDGEIVRQSERGAAYAAAVGRLGERGLVYECFCTRREIMEAPTAPHQPPGSYPGTCRHLTNAERAARRTAGRLPALRLRTTHETVVVNDAVHGDFTGAVDDMVLRRADGTHAYNLAVVIDDHDAGVDQVVRGDDLLPSTPRQVLLYRLLDLPVPHYAHVPLVLNPQGQRLAKRDGAVTLRDIGITPAQALALLGASVGLNEPEEEVTADTLLDRFDPATLPRDPWIFHPPGQVSEGTTDEPSSTQ